MDSDFRPRPRPLRQVPRSPQPYVAPVTAQTSLRQKRAIERTQPMNGQWQMLSGSKTARPKKHVHQLVSKRIIIGSIVTAGILIAGYGLRLATIQKTSPAHTATMFVQALERGDTVGALRLNAGQDQLPQIVASIKDGTITSSQENTRAQQASSRQGIVVYTINTHNGTKYVRVELMRQTDKTWRVSNVIVSDQPQNTTETS